MNNNNKTPGTLQVVLAYLTVYIVWGSTYFFISRALHGFPPFMLGAIRFIIAGLLMMIWAIWKKENLLNWASIRSGRHQRIFGIIYRQRRGHIC